MYTLIYKNDSSVLLNLPHSGTLGIDYQNHRAVDGIPRILAQTVRFDSPDVRRAIGFGCNAAAGELSGFHDLCNRGLASGIRMELARAFVDCARRRDEVISSFKTGPMLRDPMTDADIAALLEETYDQYHDGIRAQHARILATYDRVSHLVLGTMPNYSLSREGHMSAVYRRGRHDESSRTLPDVFLQHNNYRSARKALVDKVRDCFRRADMIVEDGLGEFSGGHGLPGILGDPAKGVNVIGILHVTHTDVEPDRYAGGCTVNRERSRVFRDVYRDAVLALQE